MYTRVDVALNERAFLIVNGVPVRYLRPGRHRFLRPFARVEVERHDIDAAVTSLREEHLALVSPGEIRTVTVAAHERAIVSRRGRPVRFLRPGEHQVWTVDRVSRKAADGSSRQLSAIDVAVLDTSVVVTEPLQDEVRALVPPADYAELTVAEGTVALRYVDGAIDAVLGSGRHAVWTTVRKASLQSIDLREQLLHITGQEVMTRDRVSLRMNLSAAFRVADPTRLATVAREAKDVLYLAMQLVAREAVATRTLDELLAERELLSGAISRAVAERAGSVGLEVLSFGLKDVVLPGEMKALLNRVTEAQKEAEANVISRREETAATRSLAQTAKVLAENPLVVRLKELEAYKELASRVGQVTVVLGEGAVPSLQIKAS